MGKRDDWVLLFAGAALAYVFLCANRRPRIPAEIIPLDEPALIHWAESHAALLLQ